MKFIIKCGDEYDLLFPFGVQLFNSGFSEYKFMILRHLLQPVIHIRILQRKISKLMSTHM